MAGHNLKSLSITNLDAVPVVANTIGEGGPGFLSFINDFVSPVSADDTTSTYRLCRFPTNAKLKEIDIKSTITGAGAADIDIAFSDSTTDGTPPSLSGLANPVVQISAADNKLFGSAQSLVSVAMSEFTFNGTYTVAMMNIPMWQNLVTLGATQFTSDPGGFFDIYIKVTTAITTGGIIACKIEYMV